MCKKNILIKIFEELNSMLKCKYSIMDCLCYLENSKSIGRNVGKYIKKIKENLEYGFDIYEAFELSGFENEIYQYKNFLKHQEIDSQLQKNLEYIVENENQNKEVKNSLLSVCIYPIFILILSVFLVIFLLKNKENFVSLTMGNKNLNLESGFLNALRFLFLFSICFLLWIYGLLKESFQKRFLYSIYFLLEQDYSLFDSIKIILLGEKKQKNLCLLQKIIKKLEEGEEIFQIFRKTGVFNRNQLEILEKTKWNKNYKEIFTDYFRIEKRKEKKNIERIQKYSESLLLFGIGFFLITLIQNTILPFLTF